MGMSDEALLSRLNDHPVLRSRFEAMLLIVEDELGNLREADAAEMQVIEETRKMGHEVLQSWANKQVLASAASVAQGTHVWREGKKNSTGTVHLEKSA